MAERERIPNKQRRALAREERQRAEAEAAHHRRTQRIRAGFVALVVVGVVVAVVVQAIVSG